MARLGGLRRGREARQGLLGRPRDLSELGVAIVGAGFAGGIHAHAWAETAGARVVVVVDPDPARADAVATRTGAERETSLEQALARGDVDVVDVCAPTRLHGAVTVAAARAGKHVLCEKPIALDLAEADRAITACREADVIFMVAHVLRFWPEYAALRETVEGGMLGALRAISCSRLVQTPDWTVGDWLRDPAQSRGVAGEIMIHDLDFIAGILGRPRAVTAAGLRDGAGFAHLQALLRYDGALAVAEAGWDAPEGQPFTATFRAVFERGVVEYDSRTAAAADRTEGGPWSFDAAGYLAEIRYFSECVRRMAPPARCTPEDARFALALALAVIEAAETGSDVAPA